MANVLRVLQNRANTLDQASQSRTTHGTISRGSQGRYQVVVGGVSMNAFSVVNERLKAGDRVVVRIDRGLATIIGVQARDTNA